MKLECTLIDDGFLKLECYVMDDESVKFQCTVTDDEFVVLRCGIINDEMRIEGYWGPQLGQITCLVGRLSDDRDSSTEHKCYPHSCHRG